MIIDADPYIRELVRMLLKNEGYATQEAVDGRDALQKLGETKVDLCVIDIMMPNMDGFEFCKHARGYYMDMPILMLTAKNKIGQKVRGFELGVDDYLVKPFGNAELIARVGALFKRYKIASSQMPQIGALIMDRNGYAVTTDGQKTDIPMKEFELLFKLASLPGRTFPRDQLIEDVWGLDFNGNERMLDVHIGRLLDHFPAEQFHFKITTARGLGYRLEVEA